LFRARAETFEIPLSATDFVSRCRASFDLPFPSLRYLFENERMRFGSRRYPEVAFAGRVRARDSTWNVTVVPMLNSYGRRGDMWLFAAIRPVLHAEARGKPGNPGATVFEVRLQVNRAGRVFWWGGLSALIAGGAIGVAGALAANPVGFVGLVLALAGAMFAGVMLVLAPDAAHGFEELQRWLRVQTDMVRAHPENNAG